MERIEVLGVPVDIVKIEELEGEVLKILEKKGTKQIVFLTVWDLIKASMKKKSEFRDCLNAADLVLPISKGILFGAKFLKKQIPVRYNPFSTTISILSTLENYQKSLFLFGGRKKALMTAEKNVHSTFVGLQIVGRYVGYYPKSVENDIVTGLYKSSPSLVLLGDGIKEKNLWSYHRKENFKDSIFLYYKNIIGIFSERVHRSSEKTFEKGREIWDEILRNPLKIFLIFPYIFYIIKLVCTRLFKKKSNPDDFALSSSATEEVNSENAKPGSDGKKSDESEPGTPSRVDLKNIPVDEDL